MKRALLASCLLAAGACSRHEKSFDSLNACDMLPKNVAEAALGVSLNDPQSQAFGENPRQSVISNCLYVSSGSDQIKTLTFTVRKGTVKDTTVNPAEAHVMIMKQEFGQRYELKKLEGIGTGAVWDDSLKQLTVFNGQNTYALVSPGATAPDVEDKLIALAKKAIPAS